jgi:phosphatidylserine/phosphatidylglycerophosphate/cardiolipin synthase-like enzyme
LRKLEQKLLDAGTTISRTGDEFIRYHGKVVVIDRTTLWVMAFNLTAADTASSRSFGIVTKRKAEVQDALRLFESDSTRQPFQPGTSALVVSPENARNVLSTFIRRARRQLLIYDPKVSDSAMIKLLHERAKRGVDVRIIGKVGGSARSLPHEKYPGKRMHVRAIVRDGREVFVGSQSLRKIELDNRREVGIVVRSAAIVSEILQTFEEDWALTPSGRKDRRLEEEAVEARASA